MNERPIWTAGMDAIERAIEEVETVQSRQEEVERWAEAQMRLAMWRYLRGDDRGHA